jgi:hypothetical protein
MHLRTRVFKSSSADKKDAKGVEWPAALECLILITVPEGTTMEEVGPTTASEVMYWCATGKWHLCRLFNCGTVRRYAGAWCKGQAAELPITSEECVDD